jgi:rod shape-determining protein MreB
MAVISLAGIVFSKSIRIGGDEMDEAITEHLRKTYNLMIGERAAEDIKIKIGSAYPLEEEVTTEVKGRDLVSGLPKMLTISSEEIREAMAEPIAAIIEATRITLERTPPELSADLIERGIVLAGGGSLLRGIDKLISEETGLPVHVADDPLSAVALGTGKVLSEIKYLKKVTVPTRVEI